MKVADSEGRDQGMYGDIVMDRVPRDDEEPDRLVLIGTDILVSAPDHTISSRF